MRSPSGTLESFLPRSASASVFTVAMASYSWMAGWLIRSIAHILHPTAPPPSVWESGGQPMIGVISAVVLAPLLESCVLIGVIELLRRLRSPVWVQVFFAAVALAGPHSLDWGPHAFVAMPSFAIQAASYLYWRPTSRKRAFVVVVCIHALVNLNAAMFLIGNMRQPN